ncbi:MAG TPA: metallophosphoesterase [Polyangiaceae bacterium]|nr:metallophosphoesterase [Polyangiaceae bacterium]
MPGPAPTGSVTSAGGRVSRLVFAVVGDTRPATEDDTSGYPSQVIAPIYGAIEALRPRPQFVVATGDYVFASGRGGQALPQLALYRAARSRFSGPVFPALGNHECTGATASNCGSGAPDGVTANYSAFLDTMLAPLGQALPYYAIRVDDIDGRWTAKLVFVAANAWSAEQEAWLDAALAVPTTYTFVVRHEPASATVAPGVVPSERIMAQHPYTLALVGHTHTYRHGPDAPREVLVGNGGAPLTAKSYGFAVMALTQDASVAVDMIDWQTGATDAAFHFTVQPDGSPGGVTAPGN